MLNIVLCGILSITQLTMAMVEKGRQPRNTGYFTNTPTNDIQAYHTYKNNRHIADNQHEIIYKDEHGHEKTIQYTNLTWRPYNKNEKTYLILRQYINGTTTKDAIEFPQSEIQ